MDEEITSIENNDTWKLVPRPSGKKPIGFKWIYKERNNTKKEVERYNVKLVIKGYSQKHEIDYDEVFALVVTLLD
jgi:hypothetical protein